MKKRVWIVCNLFVIMLALVACGKKEEVSTESIPAEQEVVTQAVSDSTESMQESVPDETADVEKPEDSQTTENDEELDEEMIEQAKEIEAVTPISITMTGDDNSQCRYHYDNDGDMIKSEHISQDGSGYEYEYEYLLDESGNKIKGIDCWKVAREFFYDNHKISTTDSLLDRIVREDSTIDEEYEYDENNQMIRRTEFFALSSQVCEFEHEDNKVTILQYTDSGTLKAILQYNEEGLVLSKEQIQVNGDQYICAYTYNDANQIIKEEVSETENGETWTRVCEYIYDEKGKLIKKEDSILGVTDYLYDENNNQISEKNYWTNGELYSATISEYDSNNKLLSKTVYEGTEETTLTCSYDEKDNLLIINVNDQSAFEFTYDDQNRLKKITGNEGEYSLAWGIAKEYVIKRIAINHTATNVGIISSGGCYCEFAY